MTTLFREWRKAKRKRAAAKEKNRVVAEVNYQSLKAPALPAPALTREQIKERRKRIGLKARAISAINKARSLLHKPSRIADSVIERRALRHATLNQFVTMFRASGRGLKQAKHFAGVAYDKQQAEKRQVKHAL